MLSEESIEKLILPILQRQENINKYVIGKIATKIREIGTLSPSDIYKLERLLAMGSDVREINKELARLSNLQVIDIKRLIKSVALDNYIKAKPFYDYRHKAFIPFEKNVELQKIVKSIEKVTVNTYKNISNTKMLGFVIRDYKNPTKTKFMNISETYKSVVDEAVQATQSGVINYNTAMRRTLKQLNDSGLKRVTWESGYTRRLDSTVRMHILDGVRAISQSMQDEIGKQIEADGKEISVHAMPAPDHEEVQGHQFTNEQYERFQNEQDSVDVNGRVFHHKHRPIGELNCRHFTFSIILGMKKPTYTKEQLEEIIRKNNKGYTMKNGKHLTMYECTQKQRDFEVKIRDNKQGQILAKQAGDEKLAREYQIKINKYIQQYSAFSEKCGLRMKLDNIYVSGYRKIRI